MKGGMKMLHRRRQIMVEEVDNCNVIHRGASMVPVTPGWPKVLVCCREGIDAKVMIGSWGNEKDLAIDVYLVDWRGNTVWCERDAINPLGVGRIFDCGQYIAMVVVECRICSMKRRISRFLAYGRRNELSLKVEILR